MKAKVDTMYTTKSAFSFRWNTGATMRTIFGGM